MTIPSLMNHICSRDCSSTGGTAETYVKQSRIANLRPKKCHIYVVSMYFTYIERYYLETAVIQDLFHM